MVQNLHLIENLEKNMSDHPKTETIKVGYTTFCVYCFQPAKHETRWDDRDSEEVWFCTCEMAEKEVVFKSILSEAKRKYDFAIQEATEKFEKEKKAMLNSRIHWKAKFEMESKESKRAFDLQLARIEEERQEKERVKRSKKRMIEERSKNEY
jgi:hypothetical protein